MPRGVVQQVHITEACAAEMRYRIQAADGSWAWSATAAGQYVWADYDDACRHAAALKAAGERGVHAMVHSSGIPDAPISVAPVKRSCCSPPRGAVPSRRHVEPEEVFADLEKKHLA